MSNKTANKSFTELFLTIYAVLFIVIGLLLLFITKEVSLITMKGDQQEVTNVVQQFFGSFLLLLGFLMFFIRKLKGQVILKFITALIFIGFINLYLLFSMNEYIILPTVYFIFQILMQLTFFIVLYEQMERK